VGICARRQHPQRDNYGEEADDIDDQDYTLHHGKFLGQEGVEDDGKDGDRYGQHCPVPALEYIARVVEDNKALDNCAGEEGRDRHAALPPGRDEIA